MASIDQDIGATSYEKRRLALLQDKVIFALLRTTPLTSGQLAAMELGAPEMSGEEPAVFEVEARTAGQAFAWLRWHVHHVLPKIDHLKGCQKVFISPFTGKPMGAAAIQARFKSAVGRANLAASIPRMANFYAAD